MPEEGMATMRYYGPAGADGAPAAPALVPGVAPGVVGGMTVRRPSRAPGYGGTPTSGGAPAPAEPTPVWVLADDPVTRDALLAGLRRRPEVTVLPPEQTADAQVVLMLVDRVTGRTVNRMREAAETAHRDVGFVLVGDGMQQHHLLGAVAHGPVSVIARRDADFDRIVRAVTALPAGRLEMPREAIGWLAGRLRTIHRDVLGPRGLTSTGLEVREVEVIKLLAEGLDTTEIAKRMNYSERTVNSIIHGVLTQWQLRNRAHAVAFALRTGMV
ncbi:helix-turn-helix transcriptional regulator [Catenulispora rubra]|uniref:helix-turn-helix transcriptional regulator n=1 Tax=Catenulispora rubra TaxID=280293 RepID=UPI001891F4D8|nr:response regulator transcription factor [Catenulispora rubra]